MGLMLSACSDFLDRKPLTQPDNTTFLSGREQVENYINALYPALPAPAQYGMGVRGEEVNSDNILAEKYDMRLNGENNLFSGSSDWKKGYERRSLFLTGLLALLFANPLWGYTYYG